MGLPWLNMLLLLLLNLLLNKKTGEKRQKSQQNTKNHVALHCINPFLFFVGCMTFINFYFAKIEDKPCFLTVCY